MEYQETQLFNSKLIWGTILFSALFTIFIFLLKMNKGFENKDIVGLVIVAVIFALVIAIFFFTKLKTKISAEGFFVKFNLLPIEKHIPWGNITKIELVKYGTFQYGYGFRYSIKDRLTIYNTSGNYGIIIRDNKSGTDGYLIGIKDVGKVKNVIQQFLSNRPQIEFVDSIKE